MQVERSCSFGSRGVANGCVTREQPAPDAGDNRGKLRLIPHETTTPSGDVLKGALKALRREGLAAYQLVGEVTAHQGDDA